VDEPTAGSAREIFVTTVIDEARHLLEGRAWFRAASLACLL
jgi:hypothetical protein